MCYNKNMKKNHKILTIFLCLIIFFVAGCGDGGFGAGSENSPVNLQSVKVLRKPAEYSISEIVGEENSEYFYNLLSRNIMRFLYWTYSYGLEDDSIVSEIYQTNIVNGTALENIFSGTNTDKYFYYDSVRYSIDSITVNNVDKVLEINLDTGSAWNFGFDNYYTLDESVSGFPTLALVNNTSGYSSITYSENGDELSVNANYFDYTDDIYGVPEDYSSVYYGGDVEENGVLMYGQSPYYQQEVAGEAVTALNTYQDALEYVTYLFVLGYDYENADGSVNTDDAPYFNLQISQQQRDVTLNDSELRLNMPEITVQETPSGQTNMPIISALGEIKERYNILGTYIGITDENKEQLLRFILERVIGLDENETGNYSFEFRYLVDGGGGTPDVDPPRTRTIEVNRDYENVVRNIIDVACSEVRIGGSEGNNEVFIDSAYPISEIVDYRNDYFYTGWYDENGNVTDEDVLGHVEAAQYQTMCITLPEKDVGSFLTDVQLCFEYFNDNPDAESDLYYDEVGGLTLNVGIRYYDSQGNQLYAPSPALKNVKYGKIFSDTDYHAGIDPDSRNVHFTTSDDVSSGDDIYNIVFSKIEPISITADQFDDNDIDGVLNAEERGEEINEYEHVMTISGNSPAREYYTMNESASYGQYATFNHTMFEGKCDFVEIYFDVLKDKETLNKNYNFKVGLVWVSTRSDIGATSNFGLINQKNIFEEVDITKNKYEI